MSFYADMATVARELLDQFGQTVTIRREVDGHTDPVTGVVTPGVVHTHLPRGVLTVYRATLVDGDVIRADDRSLILDDTVEPLTTDEITIDGTRWFPVQQAEAVSPAGVPLVYKVQVRS